MSLLLLAASAAIAGWVSIDDTRPHAELYVPEPLRIDWGATPAAIVSPDGSHVAWLQATTLGEYWDALRKPKQFAHQLYLGEQRRVDGPGCPSEVGLMACRHEFSGRGEPMTLFAFRRPLDYSFTTLVVRPGAPADAIATMVGSARPAGSTEPGPGTEEEATRVATAFDHDGDGVSNTADACPVEPEDADGVADEDGCPDPVNSEVFRPDCHADDAGACARFAEALQEEGRAAEASRVLRDRCEASAHQSALCVDAIGEAERAEDLPGALALAQRLCEGDHEDACWSVGRLTDALAEWEHARARSPAHLPLATLDRKMPGPCGARETWSGGWLDEDPYGGWTQTWSADGRTATRVYDEERRATFRYDHAGRETERREESLGFTWTTRTRYDDAGRPIEEVVVGGEMAGTTRWTWDERGRLVRRVQERVNRDAPALTEVTWEDASRGIELTTHGADRRPERFEISVDEQGREVRRAPLHDEGPPTEWTETSWGPFGAVEERWVQGQDARRAQVWTWDAHGNLLEHKRFRTWGPVDEGEEPFPELWIRYDYGCW